MGKRVFTLYVFEGLEMVCRVFKEWMINLFNEWILIRRGSTGWIRRGLSVEEMRRNGSKKLYKNGI